MTLPTFTLPRSIRLHLVMRAVERATAAHLAAKAETCRCVVEGKGIEGMRAMVAESNARRAKWDAEDVLRTMLDRPAPVVPHAVAVARMDAGLCRRDCACRCRACAPAQQQRAA